MAHTATLHSELENRWGVIFICKSIDVHGSAHDDHWLVKLYLSRATTLFHRFGTINLWWDGYQSSGRLMLIRCANSV